MTLLVGVFCENGIAIAADRQATHGAMGQQTVGQAVTKVHLVKGGFSLFASSGHHGLGQQLAAIMDDKSQELTNQPYDKSIQKLQDHFRPLIEKGFQTASLAAKVVGPQVASNDCICHSLLALPFKDGLRLVEITPQVGVERMTSELPFISMGSGKNCADVFLGFLKKVYWNTKQPTLVEGTLAAYWTVQHAIDMKISGVGFEVDVFTCESKDGGKTHVARQLQPAELSEHSDFIRASEEAMRSVSTQLSAADNVTPIPVPPKTVNLVDPTKKT